MNDRHHEQRPASRRTAVLATAAAALMALGVAGTAQATLPSGLTVTTFVRAALGAKGAHHGVKVSADHVKLRSTVATDVAMQTITSAPGGSSGWHSHPGIVLVAVQSGTVTVYDTDCRRKQYGPGQAFVEAGDDATLVRNNTTTSAVLYVTFIVPRSATLLKIDRPQPASCSAH